MRPCKAGNDIKGLFLSIRFSAHVLGLLYRKEHGGEIPGLVTNKRVKQGKGTDAVTLAKFQQKLGIQREPMGQAIYFSLFME